MASPDLNSQVAKVQEYSSGQYPGQYVSASIDQVNRSITVYWHGTLPDTTTFQKNTSGNINFVESPYSLAQIQSESKRISLSAPYVVSAGPSSDNKRLVVRIDTNKVQLKNVHIDSSIPITLEASPGGATPLYRDADADPFSGGTWIYNSGGDEDCSTGFTVESSGGGAGLITALHCQVSGANNDWTNPAGNEVYGTVLNDDPGTDSMFLYGANDQTYAPYIYGGPWNSGSGYVVTGYTDPASNADVCDGGGLSGEVCGAHVTSINQFLNGIGPGYYTDDSATFSYGSAGQGDSGGPSYYLSGDESMATGMIDQGINASQASCAPGSVPLGAGIVRLCFQQIFSVNITAIDKGLAVTPLTETP